MSALLVVAQVAGVAALASLVLALVVGAVLALDGRVDARDVLEVALDAHGSPSPPGPRSGPRDGGGGVLDLRDRLAPPPS